MTFFEILLVLTFVFGALQLLTYTILFKVKLSHIFNALIPYKENTVLGGILNLLGVWFFYFSLGFQAWYWMFR